MTATPVTRLLQPLAGGMLALTLLVLPVHAQRGADTSAGARLQARVWVNLDGGVYHCPGTRDYGATKAGEYMSEAQARGRGFRAALGAGCARVEGRLAEAAAGRRVWVNASSGVYHCPGSRYFGKTKKGEYMSQAAALKAGHRPAGGQSCP